MISYNLRRKYESMMRMSRHRLRITNNQLKERVYAAGYAGTHFMKVTQGSIEFHMNHQEEYEKLKLIVHQVESERNCKYEILLNPKGRHPRKTIILLVPVYETFRRDGDERHELDYVLKKVGSK